MKFLKRIFWLFVGFVGLLFVTGLGVFWYFGGFTQVVFFEEQFGPVTMVYTGYTGSDEFVARVVQDFHKNFFTSDQKKAISIYYIDALRKKGTTGSIKNVSSENPQKDSGIYVEIGSVLSGNYRAGEEKVRTGRMQEGYKVKELPSCHAVVVSFPYKNHLSYVVGSLIVYPYLNRYLIKNGYDMYTPRIELYDKEARKIDFITCLVKKK